MKVSYAIYVIDGKKRTLVYRGLDKKMVKKIINDTNNTLKCTLFHADGNRLKRIKGDEYSIVMLNHRTGEEKEVGRYKVYISSKEKKLVKII